MKAFIKKNKKSLIWGAVALAAIGVWYWKFRKPAPPVITPAVPVPVPSSMPPANMQPKVVSAATVNTNLKKAQETFMLYNRVIASIPQGRPPDTGQKTALTEMTAQLTSLGYKIEKGVLLTIK
jgi:hypothetical protein